MIVGTVDADGIPVLTLEVVGQSWRAILDTGFNADLEMPDALRAFVNPQFSGQTESILAGGQAILEDYNEITFPFDGRTVFAEATFVPGTEILVGTHLIRDYRLDINFPAGTVLLERVR